MLVIYMTNCKNSIRRRRIDTSIGSQRWVWLRRFAIHPPLLTFKFSGLVLHSNLRTLAWSWRFLDLGGPLELDAFADLEVIDFFVIHNDFALFFQDLDIYILVG